MPFGGGLVDKKATAPTILTTTHNNAFNTLTWRAPTYAGISPVTGYRIIPYIGAVAQAPMDVLNVLTANVSGVNGTAYTYTVTALTAQGYGAASAASSPTTPSTVPGAPTGVAGTSNGVQSSVVSWVAPASNGGAAITNYRVTVLIGATVQFTTVVGNVLSTTITSLGIATTYTFQVDAINLDGDGALSTASTPITTAGLASAVQSLTSTQSSGGTDGIAFSWIAPASNGGAAITSYGYEIRLTSNDSVLASGTTTLLTKTVTGLGNGTTCYARVWAINANGAGATANSNSTTTVNVPDAPTTVAATSNANQQSVVTWVAPAYNGGLAIIAYRVWAYVGGVSQGNVVVGNVLTYTYTGLTNGTGYTFKVDAINSIGDGALSVASSVATPATTPGPVQSLVASAVSGGITFSWTTPLSNGGSGITSYAYEIRKTSDNTVVASGTGGSPKTVTGLAVGTSVYARVWAVNALGAGTTTNSNSATPTGASVPDAPTIGTMTNTFYGAPGSPYPNGASIHWTDNADGGSPYTGGVWYVRRVSDNVLVGTYSFSAGPGITDTNVQDATGLVTGVPVYSQLKRSNAIGNSAISGNSNSVTPT